MAFCKGYGVSEKLKKAKKNVVITDFSKIETHLKALYVRFWGIPEGGLKALQIKGLEGKYNFPKILLFERKSFWLSVVRKRKTGLMNQTPTCKIATSLRNNSVIKTNNILSMNGGGGEIRTRVQRYFSKNRYECSL